MGPGWVAPQGVPFLGLRLKSQPQGDLLLLGLHSLHAFSASIADADGKARPEMLHAPLLADLIRCFGLEGALLLPNSPVPCPRTTCTSQLCRVSLENHVLLRSWCLTSCWPGWSCRFLDLEVQMYFLLCALLEPLQSCHVLRTALHRALLLAFRKGRWCAMDVQ